ncbi:TonB C-terminal domain-containing protein [Granulicella sp. dw_53]|uniref:TonB C-terminal domain-containing protein n=1 Tax=Granulicella sp. dw_53 TaxID=2719792 RepID=UPI001BD4443F|nr:TonB C-terminal domain-containing protein [Granulicella sp. dw_53]
MPSLETPPSSTPPSPPVKVRTGRFGELEEHELIHLLDSLDDERAKARFRESVYISLIVYLIVGWFIFYGPQVLFHQPRLINPADVLKQRDREMTYLDMPKDISKDLPRKPTKVISDKDHTAQTSKPTLDKKTLEQLQAMRRAGPPAPSKLPPTPQPQAAPQQQQAAPQQQQPQAPQPQPTPPQTQAMIDAPRPAPTKPNFGNQSQSAGSAIRQAAQQAAQNRGSGGDYGAGLPPSHNGMNTGAEVLSDTMGVDFGPYLRRILGDIKRNWEPLIPEEARPPLNKQGETLIRFTILPNGKIAAMNMDDSTHDDAINLACWSAITSEGQFPPLPKDFKGPNLELRIHFLTNRPLP